MKASDRNTLIRIVGAFVVCPALDVLVFGGTGLIALTGFIAAWIWGTNDDSWSREQEERRDG